jgi:hypothetical protein
MQARNQESPATHLLISMLIRYPEVSTLRYEPDKQLLIFTFLLQGEIDTSKQIACQQKFFSYYDACSDLDNKFRYRGVFSFRHFDDVTLVTYQQGLSNIRPGEIRLLISVLQEFFPGEVTLEPLLIDEQDLDMQEELIDRLLNHKELLSEKQQIVAYRDGGKVFVYNR